MPINVPDSAKGWNYVHSRMARELTAHHRVAWATEVVTRVVSLYSPYFQQTFHQKRAVEIARSFSLGHAVDREELRSTVEAIESHVDRAESEGYDRTLLSQGVDLLSEVTFDDGRGSVNAVDHAAVDFAHHLLFRQNVTTIGIPVAYTDDLQIPLYRFAWELFKMVSDSLALRVDRIPFDSIALNFDYPELAASLVAKAKRRPPKEEVLFLGIQ